MWPSGSGEIQTLCQAGGSASARMRCSVARSVISAPAGSRYPNPSATRTLLIPGLRGSLRESPGTADEPVTIMNLPAAPKHCRDETPASRASRLGAVFDLEAVAGRAQAFERGRELA